MNPASKRLLTLVLSSCACLPVTAGVVHKWIDADGVTHYSDTPPEIETVAATRIELPETVIHSKAGASGYYSIANQWQRLHRERLERDKLALEQARQKAIQSAQTPAIVYLERAPDASRQVTYLRSPYPRRGYYRSHHVSGRHYRHGKLKSGYAKRRTGVHVDRTSLGFYPQVQ